MIENIQYTEKLHPTCWGERSEGRKSKKEKRGSRLGSTRKRNQEKAEKGAEKSEVRRIK